MLKVLFCPTLIRIWSIIIVKQLAVTSQIWAQKYVKGDKCAVLTLFRPVYTQSPFYWLNIEQMDESVFYCREGNSIHTSRLFFPILEFRGDKRSFQIPDLLPGIFCIECSTYFIHFFQLTACFHHHLHFSFTGPSVFLWWHTQTSPWRKLPTASSQLSIQNKGQKLPTWWTSSIW